MAKDDELYDDEELVAYCQEALKCHHLPGFRKIVDVVLDAEADFLSEHGITMLHAILGDDEET